VELSLEQIESLLHAAYEKGRAAVVDVPEIIKGGWDENLHPRGDDGRFINKDEISAASKSPEKAAELRQRVTDPTERGKLNAAIGDAGKADKKLAGQYSKTPTGFAAGLDMPKKRPGTREPLPTATTGRGHSDRPDVMDTVNMARQLRRGALDQSARGELAKRLDGHTADELRQIKSELGIRATGRKAELAGKILMAAAGHDYPEQGFTGALPVKGQGVHHYEDGVLTRVEKYPAEIHSSRVTPDEAHALIEGYQSKGLLTSKEARTYIAHMLMHRMSYRDISELKRKLGLKASGRKAVYAQRIQALVEDRERRERQNPDHPANKPDPMGTMGSLAERQADIEAKRATYGGANLQHPDRKAAVDEAADRLRLAVKSPFAAFNRDAALGEVKNALNDLYNTGEVLSAAHLAGIKLDPKDGTPVQQMAAAVFRLAGGDDSPLPSKPTNLLDGLGSEQNPASVPSNHTHAITGDTYPHREAIKRAGGTWDKVAKQWTIDEEGAQYLPDGLTAEPMAHRMPKTDVSAKPEETKTLFDDVKDKGTPPAPLPTVPDHIRKQAEELKDWHQKASRHEVEYQKMLPWTADMMRDGDAKQRADVAKRMAALIAKHPELADEYGPYVKKGPNLPTPPTPEEHLAKYAHDADHHGVVDDYMAQGGHPNDLYRHLKPEAVNESYSNRTGLIRARTNAINSVKDHLAGKAPPPVTPPADESVSILPGGAGLKKIAENKWDAHLKHLANPKPGEKSPVDEFLEETSRTFRPRSAVGYSREEEDVIAWHLRDMMARHEGAKAAKTEPEQPAATPLPSSDLSESDTSPGRTEHLQAVASGAGVDELRDAADTVSRIEDIPHGERTADDRAELKRAKELAAAGDVPAQSSTGAKNPAQYVDDHPEVTADNPLGLPVSAENTPSPTSAPEKPHESPTSAPAEPVQSSPPEPDTHTAKIADLEGRMAEAKRQAANKSNGRGDRAVWERHHDELDDQHAELTGRVRALAEHEAHVKRAEKRKDHERLAKLKGMEAAVHSQHIDNHVAKLDKRIAKMDAANTITQKMLKQGTKLSFDSEMKARYPKVEDAIEDGIDPKIIAYGPEVEAAINRGTPRRIFGPSAQLRTDGSTPDHENGTALDTFASEQRELFGTTNEDAELHGSDQHGSDWALEKIRSGEPFSDGDEHRQSLAAERDAIHSERDGKPETDAAIVATLKAGKTPKGKAAAVKEPEKPSPPANQAALIRKIGIDAQNRDMNEPMKHAQGVDSSIGDIPHEIASQFDAHGTSTVAALASLLNGGVDKNRQLFSSPLSEIHNSQGYGTTVRGNSPFVVLGHPGETLSGKGIGGVLVDDLHSHSIPELQQAFPGVKFVPAKDAASLLPKVAAGGSGKKVGYESPSAPAPTVPERKQYSLDEIMGAAAGQDAKTKEERPKEGPKMDKLATHEKKFRDVLDRIGSDTVTSADIDDVEKGLGELSKDELAELMPRLKVAGKPKSKGHAIRQITGVLRNQLVDNVKYGAAAKQAYGWKPDTATEHGKASAIPIGVTQKDDYESRGRGVRKAVESPAYLLPL
jgi:hypothetical protein